MTEYVAAIKFGYNDEKIFPCLIDTGSADLWIYSDKCDGKIVFYIKGCIGKLKKIDCSNGNCEVSKHFI